MSADEEFDIEKWVAQMKRFSTAIAVIALTFVVVALAPAQTGDAKAEEQVRELCDALNQALIKADVPTLNKIFAEEFTIVRPNGMAVGKEEAVKDVESGKTKFVSIEASDSKVRIYGNTAVMTTLEDTSAVIGGHSISGQARNTYVCVRRDGR